MAPIYEWKNENDPKIKDPGFLTGDILLIFPMVSSLQPANARTDLTNPGLAPNADIFANSGQALGDETGNGVALGDLDGDGDVDAFVANDYGLDGASQVWLNDGEGYFTSGRESGAMC
jgi:hypothetical protein